MSMIHRTEAAEQTALFEWAEWEMNVYPELQLLHAIPNGGSRNKAEAANLKRQGVKPGVSDLLLPVARHGFHGLYIELKRIGGRIRPTQAEWINMVRQQGYAAFVCYGMDEAREKLEWYLEGAHCLNTPAHHGNTLRNGWRERRKIDGLP